MRLDLRGLASFGRKVDVEVREVTLTGAQGLATTPPVIKVLDGVSLHHGAVTLDVPTYDRFAAYQVIITPEQVRCRRRSHRCGRRASRRRTPPLPAPRSTPMTRRQDGGWQFMVSHSKDVGSFNAVDSRADWTVAVPRNGKYRFQVIGGTSGPPGRHALFVDGVHSRRSSTRPAAAGATGAARS